MNTNMVTGHFGFFTNLIADVLSCSSQITWTLLAARITMVAWGTDVTSSALDVILTTTKRIFIKM